MRILGEGTFGSVRLRSDHLAVKEVAWRTPDATCSTVSVTALREMHLMQTLAPHPNVIERHAVTVQGDRLLFVMRCYPMTLHQLITAPLLPEASKRYARDLFAGLAFLHACCVMHRDIKPSNLLIGTDECLKIADFGLARAVLPSIRSYTRDMVTLYYRSYELLVGESYSYDIDIWSAACVVSEMTTARVLFRGDTEADMLRLQRKVLSESGEAGLVASLGAELVAFLRPLFATPSTRPTASSLVKHAYLCAP